jgi:uncharacterized protein YkuJ
MFLTLLITISLFDIYDLLITSQHNHKRLPKSKENIVLRGGQFESAGGGQFAPARTDFYTGTGVVNLDRQTLVKVNGLSRCGSSLRYSFTIFHPQWGTLEVGTICCDNLTDSEVASNFKESRLKFQSRKQRFIDTKRWINDGQKYCIKQGLFEIEIFETSSKFCLRVNGKKSKITHDTLDLAKTRVFDIIEDGSLMKFFKDQNYDFDKHKKERRKKKNHS